MDPLSGPVAGGLDRQDWSWGPVAVWLGGCVRPSGAPGPAAGGLDRQDWSWGPVAVWLGGCVPLSGAAVAGTGAPGHGVLPGAG
jgi:hypothetical protein